LASLPIILASVWFALGTTADLSGGMKLVLLMVAVCTRFGDMAVTPLSIEFAKGNEAEAANKMAHIAHITGAISACAALFIICVNPAFIHWWMMDKISWSWHENVSGAIWIAIIAITQCMYGYAVVSRRLGIIRWAQLSECLIYIALAFGLRFYAGSAALLWAKPVATLFITGVVAWQIGMHTHFESRKILPIFLRQFLVLALLTPLCLRLGHLITSTSAHPFLQLIYSGLLSLVAMLLAIPFLTTRAMKTDCRRMALNMLRRWHRTSH
jgi:hypothetical protein